jgi:diguanylate cyclase (GGDEF)-like protein
MANDISMQDRAAFQQAVEALGAETAVAVALTDLDGFAGLNNTYGRDAADDVLRTYERTLSGSLPADAIVARIGGDEFAVALPDASAESALILLEEVRAHFGSRPAAASVPVRVGMSAGISSRPPHAVDPPDLVRAAEEALFRAKREGGARVAIYVEEKMVLKSNYYPKAALARLAKLSDHTNRTEASLLREALDDLLTRYRGQS